MNRLLRSLPFLLAGIAFLVPDHASAQIGFSGLLGGLAPQLPSVLPGDCLGDCGFANIAEAVVINVRPLLVTLAGILIVINGYRMIIGQEDDIADKAKATMTASISGILMLYLYRPFIGAFYGLRGSVLNQGNVNTGVSILSAEVAGLINWVLVIVAALAVTMIIVSGLRAIGSSASDEGITQLRRTVFSVAAGIFILILRSVLNRILGLTPPDEGVSNPNPTPDALFALEAAITVLQYVLGFIGLIAVTVFIYAGILMIFTLGDEERYNQGKGIITRAAIGLVVIIVSMVLVGFILDIV